MPRSAIETGCSLQPVFVGRPPGFFGIPRSNSPERRSSGIAASACQREDSLCVTPIAEQTDFGSVWSHEGAESRLRGVDSDVEQLTVATDSRAGAASAQTRARPEEVAPLRKTHGRNFCHLSRAIHAICLPTCQACSSIVPHQLPVRRVWARYLWRRLQPSHTIGEVFR